MWPFSRVHDSLLLQPPLQRLLPVERCSGSTTTSPTPTRSSPPHPGLKCEAGPLGPQQGPEGQGVCRIGIHLHGSQVCPIFVALYIYLALGFLVSGVSRIWWTTTYLTKLTKEPAWHRTHHTPALHDRNASAPCKGEQGGPRLTCTPFSFYPRGQGLNV